MLNRYSISKEQVQVPEHINVTAWPVSITFLQAVFSRQLRRSMVLWSGDTINLSLATAASCDRRYAELGSVKAGQKKCTTGPEASSSGFDGGEMAETEGFDHARLNRCGRVVQGLTDPAMGEAERERGPYPLFR